MDKADLSQILIILKDILTQTCNVFFDDLGKSSSLKETLSITLSVCSLKGRSVLEFLNKGTLRDKEFVEKFCFF